MCFKVLKKLFGKGGEQPSPGDWLLQENMSYEDGVFTARAVPFSRVWLTTVADTHSMDPTIDIGHTAILGFLQGFHDRLQTGDICVYYVPEHPTGILHRIVEIGHDENGRYYIFKGDNNWGSDPYRLRDADVEWVLVGILY